MRNLKHNLEMNRLGCKKDPSTAILNENASRANFRFIAVNSFIFESNENTVSYISSKKTFKKAGNSFPQYHHLKNK